MAKSATMFLLLVLSAMLTVSPATGFEGKVGGRMEVRDVKNNKEVQELGRFSIHEFNKLLLHHGGNDCESALMFSKVVEAEKQVVSGVKYYMKIEATSRTGEKRFYHSVVVVKPWLKSKELVKFEPAAAIELRRFK